MFCIKSARGMDSMCQWWWFPLQLLSRTPMKTTITDTLNSFSKLTWYKAHCPFLDWSSPMWPTTTLPFHCIHLVIAAVISGTRECFCGWVGGAKGVAPYTNFSPDKYEDDVRLSSSQHEATCWESDIRVTILVSALHKIIFFYIIIINNYF